MALESGLKASTGQVVLNTLRMSSARQGSSLFPQSLPFACDPLASSLGASLIDLQQPAHFYGRQAAMIKNSVKYIITRGTSARSAMQEV